MSLTEVEIKKVFALVGKREVDQAFLDYKKGKRPNRYKEAKSSFVKNKEGYLYPAKIIWGLASSVPCADFNRNTAFTNLKKLGYECVIMQKENEIFLKEVRQ